MIPLMCIPWLKIYAPLNILLVVWFIVLNLYLHCGMKLRPSFCCLCVPNGCLASMAAWRVGICFACDACLVPKVESGLFVRLRPLASFYRSGLLIVCALASQA
jgi:hypothetical protein